MLIYRKKRFPASWKRSIEWTDDSVVVKDSLRGDPSALRRLIWSPVFTTIHMGSSRYFLPNEALELDVQGGSDPVEIDLNSLEKGIELERSVRF